MRRDMEGKLPPFVRRQDGSVILETAIMITVLLLLIFGMIDFGRVMYTENSLISAAREGARYGAVQSSPVSSSGVQGVVRSRFNQYTFGGDTLTNSAITVTDSSTAATPFVKVSIAYTFKWISPVAKIASIIAKQTVTYTTTLHSAATYRYESQ
jgi:Flp pilus assembly protein TadG